MKLLEYVLKFLPFLFKANSDFFKLLNEFHDKLPPKHKQATKHYDIVPLATVMNTGNMKMNLTTAEIDAFHKKLENFNYNQIIFRRKAIRGYSENIQRLLRDARWEEFGVATVQGLLEDEAFQTSKPYLFGYRIGKRLGY